LAYIYEYPRLEISCIILADIDVGIGTTELSNIGGIEGIGYAGYAG